jgi:hypothetical protein
MDFTDLVLIQYKQEHGKMQRPFHKLSSISQIFYNASEKEPAVLSHRFREAGALERVVIREM